MISCLVNQFTSMPSSPSPNCHQTKHSNSDHDLIQTPSPLPKQAMTLNRIGKPQTAPSNSAPEQNSYGSNINFIHRLQNVISKLYKTASSFFTNRFRDTARVEQTDVGLHIRKIQLITIKTAQRLPGRGMYLLRVSIDPGLDCLKLNGVLTRLDCAVSDFRRPLRQGLPGCGVRLPGDILELAEA